MSAAAVDWATPVPLGSAEAARLVAARQAHRAVLEDRWPDAECPAEAESSGGMASRVLDRAQLVDLPRPSPLIADTLDLGTVAVLAGHFGTLKSFIAQDWASCVATGRRWMGRSVERCRVLYLAAEGAYGMHDRLHAWEYAWQHRIDPGSFSILPEPVHLGSPAAVAELCHLVDQGAYGLVVVDTLAKSITGMDENSAQDMGRAVAALYRIAAATSGGTVVALHHTGKDRTTVRGSSALEAGVDTVYTTEGDARLVKLTRTKRKDGPTEDVHTLTLQLVQHTSSGVVVSAAGADMTGSQRQLMSAFMSAFGATGASKADLRAVSGMAPATFHRSLNALVSGGALTNTGSQQRPFYRAGER